MTTPDVYDGSEDQIIKDFQQQTRGSWCFQPRYDHVTVLLLSWVEDDLGVSSEIGRLQLLFEKDLKYNTEHYQIPSVNSEAELARKLTSFVTEYALSVRSLLIVYYGGHADNTVADAAGYPAWRARLDSGPTVDWFLLQPHLANANGDVLVLLDCCYAATRNYRTSDNGQFEILAASSSGSRVPKPGRLSFTSVLIRELRKQVLAGYDVPIRWLSRHLWSPSTALTESPQYYTLAKDDSPTIRLTPLAAPLPQGFKHRNHLPSSFAVLSVAFTEDPTANQIADWLKSYPPNIVQQVNIEGLVLKARLIQGLNEGNQLFGGSVLGGLSQSAQAEILERVRQLSHVMKASEMMAQQNPSANDVGAAPAGKVLGHIMAETLKDLKEKVVNVSESVQKGILLDPNVDLANTSFDTCVAACEVGEVISLRERLLGSSSVPEQVELPRKSLTWDTLSRRGKGVKPSRLRTGKYQGRPIVAEVLDYNLVAEAPTSGGPPSAIFMQFRKMVAQICHPKQASFHILPGLGYMHERSSKTLSLIFELKDNRNCSADKPVSLINLSQYMSRRKRVALGERIKLAARLGQALESFHKVGWVHKSLKSDNIVFVAPSLESDISVDLDCPWLFGFEYSRPEDDGTFLQTDYSVENNAYKHPERWGKPLVKFKKAHDVYSLGIILSELMHWKPVKSFPEMKQKNIDPEKVKDDLIERLREDGPHICGQSFTDAVVSCLRFKELAQGMSNFDAHGLFRSEVVDRLLWIERV